MPRSINRIRKSTNVSEDTSLEESDQESPSESEKDGVDTSSRRSTHNLFFGVELHALRREITLNCDNIDSLLRTNKDISGDSEDLDISSVVDSCFYFLRQVALGEGAKENERNILEIEASDISGSLIRMAVASLSRGLLEMARLDLNFDVQNIVTLYLVEGSGPLIVTGRQEISLAIPVELYALPSAASDEEVVECENSEVIEGTTTGKRKLVTSDKDAYSKPKRAKRDTESLTKLIKSKFLKDKEKRDSEDDDEDSEQLNLSERDLRRMLKQKEREKKLQQKEEEKALKSKTSKPGSKKSKEKRKGKCPTKVFKHRLM